MATNALAALLATTSSTASTAPPAARNAASNEPGDIEVSPSSRTRPSSRRGLADRLDIFLRVAERDGLEVGHRRLLARQRWNFSCSSACSIARSRSGRSGWPVRREMIETGGMAERKRGHRWYSAIHGGIGNATDIPLAVNDNALGRRQSSGTKKSGTSGCVGSTR